VYLRDIGTIQDSTDIIVGYAHVNGRRTVYIPVTKRADASTLSVIQNVRQALPRMRPVVPDDVRIELVFDQSGYVINPIRALVSEGLLGALLTGLTVILFLRDWRRLVHRDDHDSLCAALGRRLVVGSEPDGEHHDPRRARAGCGRAGG
jgi:multidrug efflux pump subunit AcrB